MNLKHKAIKGMGWVIMTHLLAKAVVIASTVILARLLSPGDFGIIAIAALIFAFVDSLCNMGINDALIQRPRNIRQAADSAFVMSVMIGSLWFLIFFFSSFFLAGFFSFSNASLLASVIRMISLKFIIDSFGIIQSVLLQKELEFKKRNSIIVVSALFGSISSICLAIMGFGVWALVYGLLIENMVRSCLLWIMCPWKPRIRFESRTAKELFSYGKHILSANIIIYFANKIDMIFVGRLLGDRLLGLYSMAFNLSNLAYDNISSLVSSVLFPSFSKIRSNVELVRQTYLNSLKFISLFSFPAMLGIFILAPEITRLVLGQKWVSMTLALQILCIYGLIRSVVLPIYDLVKAIGRPEIMKHVGLMTLAIILITIYPLTVRFGIAGTAFSVLLSIIITQAFAHIRISRMAGISIFSIFKTLFPQLLSSLIMTGALYSTKLFLGEITLFCLAILIITGVFIYSALILSLQRTLIKELKDLLDY